MWTKHRLGLMACSGEIALSTAACISETGVLCAILLASQHIREFDVVTAQFFHGC